MNRKFWRQFEDVFELTTTQVKHPALREVITVTDHLNDAASDSEGGRAVLQWYTRALCCVSIDDLLAEVEDRVDDRGHIAGRDVIYALIDALPESRDEAARRVAWRVFRAENLMGRTMRAEPEEFVADAYDDAETVRDFFDRLGGEL